MPKGELAGVLAVGRNKKEQLLAAIAMHTFSLAVTKLIVSTVASVM
jgi:uncharacterized protein (UPF0261 family)